MMLFRLPNEPADVFNIRAALAEAREALAAGESVALAQRRVRRARDAKTHWEGEAENRLRIEVDRFLGRI